MRGFFHGKFFIALLLVCCFLLGFMLNLAVDGGKMPHKELVGMIVTPIQTGFTWVKNKAVGFFQTFSKYDQLEEENRELRARIAELEKEQSEFYYMQVQNERYRKMLSIVSTEYSFEHVSADVVSVSRDGWVSSFGINAGTAVGIQKEDVVICEDGLVGIVSDVGLNWATVMTFTDPQNSVGAMVLSTGDVGVTEGTLELRRNSLCRVSYFSRDAVLNRGDRVYTSGLGGVYPKGLLLGTIAELGYEQNGLSQYAILQPAADFEQLKEVLVITSFSLLEE